MRSCRHTTRFVRKPTGKESSLIVSRCRHCHEFVAAGISEISLAIVERLHRCPAAPNHSGLQEEEDSRPVAGR